MDFLKHYKNLNFATYFVTVVSNILKQTGTEMWMAVVRDLRGLLLVMSKKMSYVRISRSSEALYCQKNTPPY